MRISKEILVNVSAVKYSPCGEFLALPYSNELNVVRTSDRIDIFNVRCSDRITSVDWSLDSDHILCVVANGSVEVFSISSPDWTCTIQESTVGLSSAVWSPKGTHIVTVALFAVRLSVWSLVGRSVAFVENPVMKAKDKLSFSPDGESLAVITGKIGQFNISLFSTFWTEISCIKCSQDREIISPSVPIWSPNSCYISIWETIDLSSATLHIYDVRLRQNVGRFTIESKNWEPRGISFVVWTPNSQFLLIGCRNDQIYILNYINWSVIAVFRHEKVIVENCDVLQEINGQFSRVKERPVKFTFIARKLPGVSKIVPSSDGRLVASICQLLPAVVWIWNLERFSLLAVVILRNRVGDLKWGRGHKLTICDESKVTLWEPSGIKQILLESHRGIKVRKCTWHPGMHNQCLIFTTRSVFTVSGL